MKYSTIMLLFWAFATSLFAQPGALDHSFGGGDGIVTLPFIGNAHAVPEKVIVQSDGKILLVGGTWIPSDTIPEVIAMARLRPDGTLDPGFNGTGKITIGYPGYSVSAEDVALLPDGKMLLCCNVWKANQGFLMVARINSNGTPDASFGVDGFAIKSVGSGTQYARAMAVQADGKIVIGGSWYTNNNIRGAMIRFLPNGTPDNSFGNAGVLITDIGEGASSEIFALKVQPDGKIVAAGYGTSNGKDKFAIARFNSNGTPDNLFGNAGKKSISLSTFSDKAQSMLLQPDGKIILTGYAAYGQLSDEWMAVVRLNNNGTPDNSFGVGGVATLNISSNYENAKCAVLQPDGKILIGGYCQGYFAGTSYHFTVARLNSNGSPDTTFGNGLGYSVVQISPSGEFITSMCPAPDGNVFCAGNARVNNFEQFAVAKFITGISTATSSPEKPAALAGIYPNPVVQEATLRYELNGPQTVSVVLSDMNGRYLETLVPASKQDAGNHSADISLPQGLPAGAYLIVLHTEAGNQSLRIIH